VRRAPREFANPAVSAPVELVVGSKRATIPAAAVGRSLSMAPDATHHLQPSLDGERLHALIAEDLAGDIEKPGRDATFRIVKKRPRVGPASSGKAVAPDALAANVLRVLTRSGNERRAEDDRVIASSRETDLRAWRRGAQSKIGLAHL
jgi:hypothetical protein